MACNEQPLPELGQVRHQLVKGHKVELDSGGPLCPLPVPGPLQEVDGGRPVHAQRVALLKSVVTPGHNHYKLGYNIVFKAQ